MRILLLLICAIQLSACPDDYFYTKFREILSADYGFTLLGAKPLSFDDFRKADLDKNEMMRRAFILRVSKLFEGSPRFLFRIKEGNESVFGAFLIDQKAFDHMGASIEEIIFETARIGELFGYGRENAEFYMRYVQLGVYLKKPPIVWLVPKAPRGAEDALPSVCPKIHFCFLLNLKYLSQIPDLLL